MNYGTVADASTQDRAAAHLPVASATSGRYISLYLNECDRRYGIHGLRAEMTAVPDFRIREANEADCGLILTFIRELAEHEQLLNEVVATEQDVRESLFGSQRRAEVLIAMEGDAAVGFALFFHNYSTFLCRHGLYIEDLYVRNEVRGRGYGRRLLAHLARLALSRGCRRVEWIVLDQNAGAVEFYKAIGARPMDEWTLFRLTGSALHDLAEKT